MTWLLWLPPLLTAVSAFALTHAALEGATGIGMALRKRLTRRFWWVPRRAFAPGNREVAAKPRAGIPLHAPWIGAAIGMVLAILWRHPVLSPWFVFLGAAAGWMLVSTRPAARREDLSEMETFLSALRSVFGVDQSVFASLQTAAETLDEGALKHAVLEAVRRYAADLDMGRALAALREARLPFLERLALILDQVQFADDEVLREALLDLENRIGARRRLQARAQTTLTLTRLTLRALQAANLTALAAVTVLPMWREFYTTRPLGLVAATGMMVAGSWYFASEVKRMEELL